MSKQHVHDGNFGNYREKALEERILEPRTEDDFLEKSCGGNFNEDAILSTELLFTDEHCCSVNVENERENVFCWNGLWCFLLGCAQVVGGVALCALAPALAAIGMTVVMEGISDCYEGIKGMLTGVFSWKEWAVSKATSLLLALLALGINKYFKW